MVNDIKVTVLHCGNVDTDSSTLFYEEDANYPECMYYTARPKEYHITPPVYAFLIEHPKGKILYDTSWGKEVRENPEKEIGTAYLVDRPILLEGQSVDEQLKMMGIKAEELDYVVLGHMHVDHAGGLRHVSEAKHILVSKEELQAAKEGDGYCSHMWQEEQLELIPFAPDNTTPWNKSYDIFGDRTVKLVFLPGHTPGMTAILIQNHGKSLLLTGDCGYARKSWEQMILPGLIHDKETIVKSLSWIKQLSEEEDCIDCIAAHESDLNQKVFNL